MDYFIKTERLGFGRWQKDDLQSALLLWGEQAVSRYISRTGVFSTDEIKAKLAAEVARDKEHSVQYWPIFLLSGDDGCGSELVGCCGLRLFGLRTAAAEGEYEMGFHLRQKFWGKGLAQEATRAVVAFAFNNLNATAIFAGHNPLNTRSKKTLERLGFKFVSDNFYPPTGLMHPTYVLRSE